MRYLIRIGAAAALLALFAARYIGWADGAGAGSGLLDSRREDIAAFRSDFLAKDRSYAPAARSQAEERLARLEASAGTVSQAYFELELARIVALADNGHTASFPGPRSRHYNRVAMRLVPFGEDFYVLRAEGALSDLLGARLDGIEDRPMQELRAAARSLAGGTPPFRDRNAGYFLESPEQLHALGLIREPDAATYRFILPGGDSSERRLVAEPANNGRARANADRWLYPEMMPSEPQSWRPLLVADQAPWSLRDPDTPFRMRHDAGLEALVLELRQNNDAAGMPIEKFLKEAAARIQAARPRNLVLDMRLNGGGDLNTTRDFVEGLPGKVPGRLFVLTSPWTFSAAISTVGYLKQAAPERVTIVGEAVGDRLNFFAEGRIVTLPRCGAVLLIATQRHDYAGGCRGYDDCHGPVVRHPIAVHDLDPAIKAPWTIEAYRAGRDPGMEAIAAALGSGV